jgi:hypothetical protein
MNCKKCDPNNLKAHNIGTIHYCIKFCEHPDAKWSKAAKELAETMQDLPDNVAKYINEHFWELASMDNKLHKCSICGTEYVNYSGEDKCPNPNCKPSNEVIVTLKMPYIEGFEYTGEYREIQKDDNYLTQGWLFKDDKMISTPMVSWNHDGSSKGHAHILRKIK